MSLQMQMPVSAGTEADIQEKDFGNSLIQKSIINIISHNPQQNSSTNCKFYETDIFNRIKEMLDITQVLEYYGVSVNSKSFASCPFHQEKTPSFKIYDGSYHCFGCGESGTVIDFVMNYFGLTNIEAVKKLKNDFRLNLSVGNHVGARNARPFHEIQKNKNLVENFTGWEKRAFITVSSYFRTLKEYESSEADYIENILDIMIANMHDFKAQVEFYKNFGEAVKYIEHKLQSQR